MGRPSTDTASESPDSDLDTPNTRLAKKLMGITSEDDGNSSMISAAERNRLSGYATEQASASLTDIPERSSRRVRTSIEADSDSFGRIRLGRYEGSAYIEHYDNETGRWRCILNITAKAAKLKGKNHEEIAFQVSQKSAFKLL